MINLIPFRYKQQVHFLKIQFFVPFLIFPLQLISLSSFSLALLFLLILLLFSKFKKYEISCDEIIIIKTFSEAANNSFAFLNPKNALFPSFFSCFFFFFSISANTFSGNKGLTAISLLPALKRKSEQRKCLKSYIRY